MAEKIVKYHEWCNSCVYYKCDPGNDDNPCNNCLCIPVNIDSHKPIFWKGDGKNKPKNTRRNFTL